MDVRNEMLKLVRSRRDGFSLQQPFYIDPDFHKLDMEPIWYRDWLFVGHDCELPSRQLLHRPGRRLSGRHRPRPRRRDPRLPQFLPPSRHAASAPRTRARRRELVCPYHQWTYELDGTLLFARHMGEDFDKAHSG